MCGWCVEMGGSGDCPSHAKHEKTLILHMLREMWLNGDMSLHRIYSSWEQLEANLEITTETATPGKHRMVPCPTCGAKQKINLPFEGLFPYQTCQSCHNPFHVNKDSTLRKLTEEEKKELPGAWVQVVEDMNKQKVAVTFRLE
jgi:transposase-like protein